MRAFLLAGLLMAAFFANARGDGVYVPERAFQKLPEIPTQRALLSWRDGVETLLIASTASSESQRLGWIIPLPAEPTVMEKAEPGALETLAFCIQPRILHDLSTWWKVIGLLGGLFLIGLWVAIFVPGRFVDFGLITILGLLASSLGMPTLGGGGRPVGTSAVQTHKTARVGAYEISVLKAKDSSALDAWLSGNGFSPLPASAKPVLEEYIRQGWVFLASKLARSEAGENTPHPLKIAFPAAQPVYPWRLTALAGGAPRLELFVVGKERASVRGLKAEFCDAFKIAKGEAKGAHSRIAIGHEALLPFLWDGCVVTKLSGKLESSANVGDFAVEWTPYEPLQRRIFSPRGARHMAGIVAMVVFGVTMVGGFALTEDGYQKYREPGPYFLGFGRWAVLTAAVASATTYLLLPNLPGREVHSTTRRRAEAAARHLQYEVEGLLDEAPALKQLPVDAMFDQIVAKLPEQLRRNAYDGGDLRLEASPGNISITKDGDFVRAIVRDDTGKPLFMSGR